MSYECSLHCKSCSSKSITKSHCVAKAVLPIDLWNVFVLQKLLYIMINIKFYCVAKAVLPSELKKFTVLQKLFYQVCYEKSLCCKIRSTNSATKGHCVSKSVLPIQLRKSHCVTKADLPSEQRKITAAKAVLPSQQQKVTALQKLFYQLIYETFLCCKSCYT